MASFGNGLHLVSARHTGMVDRIFLKCLRTGVRLPPGPPRSIMQPLYHIYHSSEKRCDRCGMCIVPNCPCGNEGCKHMGIEGIEELKSNTVDPETIREMSVKGYSQAEIARRLGISLSAVVKAMA